MYEATTICETPDVTNAKLYQLERMSQTALNGGLSMDAILKELLAEWEQPYLSAASLELSIDSLSHMISAYRKQTVHVNRLLVTTLMEKVNISLHFSWSNNLKLKLTYNFPLHWLH